MSSEHIEVFTGIVIVYKGIFIVFGAALAALTRKVNIKALNDRREIGLCIYTVALVAIIIMPMVGLVENPKVKYAFSAFALWFITTILIGLLFGRKMMVVYSGRHAEDTVSNFSTKSTGGDKKITKIQTESYRIFFQS